MARHQGILYSDFSAPSFALFALKEKTILREGHFCSAFANLEKKKKYPVYLCSVITGSWIMFWLRLVWVELHEVAIFVV